MNARINKAEDCEPIDIYLTEDKFPIAYKKKLEELIEEGMEEYEARAFIRECPIELELIYHKGLGLFAVESEAVECTTIYSPYDGSVCDGCDDNE